MKRLLIFFFLILPVTGWGYIGSGIVINEVQPGGDGSASSPDWIELYNNSDQTINIWDWMISDQDPNNWDSVDPSSPNCQTSGGNTNYTDCDYRIPSDPELTDTLNVSPGCYVVIYNTSGTNDYSCEGDNKIVLYMNREGDDIFSKKADDVILIQRYGEGTDVYDFFGTALWLVTDYVAWDTGFGSPDDHPTKCGSNDSETYPNFKVYASDDADAQDQCSDASSKDDIPYLFSEDDSSRGMDPIKQQLGSTYSRVPNGEDTDSNSDFTVAEDSPGTTASIIEYFRVVPHNKDFLLVSWKTGFEKDIIGFNILESAAPDGKYIRRNGETIRARGIHSDYSILLRVLNPTPTIYYKLEVLRKDGKSEFYGPVEVHMDGKEGINALGGTKLVEKTANLPSSGCSHVPAGGIFAILIMVVVVLIPFKRILRKRR